MSDRIVQRIDRIIKMAFRGKWPDPKGTQVKPWVSPIDCLVLAGAAHLQEAMSGAYFLSADKNQSMIARRLGLKVCDPSKERIGWIRRTLARRPGPRGGP